MSPFGDAARTLFLLEPRTRFLNHGSFGALPRAVAQAADAWRRLSEANPDRFMREILPVELRRAAARLAAFLRAAPEDVVFVENATAGVNAVLRSLDFRAGDEILATDHCYGAVRQAIRYVCERTGATLVEVAIPLPLESGIFDRIGERITARTKLLVVDHIASPTGLIFPVDRLAKTGIRILVDGAHAPGQIELDVPAIGADWYVGNCHKWLFAARGCGFLWARKEAQSLVHPLSISHDYGKSFSAEFDWTGTRDFSAWLAVADAIDFFKPEFRDYNHALVVEAAKRLARAWDSEVDGPDPLHGSMIGVRLPKRLQGMAPRALQSEWLARHATVAAVTSHAGVLWARLSAQIYNTAEDYRVLETV